MNETGDPENGLVQPLLFSKTETGHFRNEDKILCKPILRAW